MPATALLVKLGGIVNEHIELQRFFPTSVELKAVDILRDGVNALYAKEENPLVRQRT
jgi:hypothetical protein